MFDFDKTIHRLEKFVNLSGREKQEVLEDIFVDTGFREWFYQVGENSKSQPMTTQMVNKLFTTLCIPSVLKGVIRFWKAYDYDKLDKTACCIAFLVGEQAIEQSNKAVKEISEGYRNGEINSRDAKTYKQRSETYNDMITELMDCLKNRTRGEVKSICSKTNLPVGLVYSIYFMVPGRRYIQKHKISMFMNQILTEIYKWTGACGLEDIEYVRWGPLFGTCFGNELVASADVSILLEGVSRIDNYRDSEYFDDVRSVWDSLTNFALTDLNNAPENVRRHMLEIYLKRITKIFTNGRTPRLRVDILAIPMEFSNLVNTIRRYANRIHDITQSPHFIPDNTPRTAQGMNEQQLDRSFMDDDGDIPGFHQNKELLLAAQDPNFHAGVIVKEEHDPIVEEFNSSRDDADDFLTRDLRDERARRERDRRDRKEGRNQRRDSMEENRRSSKNIFGNDPGKNRDNDDDDDPFFYEDKKDDDDDDLYSDEEKRIDDDDGDYYPPDDDEEDEDPLSGID